MKRAHKIRMYPTAQQAVKLLKTAGTARYAYNWALVKWQELYRAHKQNPDLSKPSAVSLSSLWTVQKPEWASEIARCAQTQAIINLGKAYGAFFKKRAKRPTFHKKDRKNSFYIANDKAYLKDNFIHLPQIGKVKLAQKLRFEGKILSYTVSHYADQWHVSVQVELEGDPRPQPQPNSTVGIDVGLLHVAVASDGTTCDAPDSLKNLERKLKARQRALSRSQRNSKNYQKKLLKKQKVQQKIDNIRKDVTHKFTSTLCKNHAKVVTQDLNIKGMMERAQWRSMRRSLNHSMMGMILQQIVYKAIVHQKVDRYFPSTKLCSHCDHKKQVLPLASRTYECQRCGAVIDRDFNAAMNLYKAGAVSAVASVE